MTADVTRQGIVAEDTRGDTRDDGSGSTAPDPTGSSGRPARPDRRSAGVLIVASVLAGLLVVGAVVAGLFTGPRQGMSPPRAAASSGPLRLAPVAAPLAGSPECAALLRALPATLPDGGTPLPARRLATPAPPAAAAWGGGPGAPVVLRCGVGRPAQLTPTSALIEVTGVRWFTVSTADATTWYAVDRAATVALTLPGDIGGTGPIQDVSGAITATMPPVPVY